MQHAVERLQLLQVSLLLCTGVVDSPLLTLCASHAILVLSCVPNRVLDGCRRLSLAIDVPHVDHLSPSHVGLARGRLLDSGWTLQHSAARTSHRATDEGAACQLLLCPAAAGRGPTVMSVFSSHATVALSHQYTFQFWHGLHRVRNAARDGWRLWRGGGATEVEWIRHLQSDSLGDAVEGTDVELYRPLVVTAFVEVLRRLVTQCVTNVGVGLQQADELVLRCIKQGGAPIREALKETGKQADGVDGLGEVWDVRCEKLGMWDAAITACQWLTTCDTLLQAKDGRTTVTTAEEQQRGRRTHSRSFVL